MMWTLTPHFWQVINNTVLGRENSMPHVFIQKKMINSFWRKDLFSFTRFPAELNNRLLGTLDAVTQSTRFTSHDKYFNSAINNWHAIYRYLEPSLLLCIAELNIAISLYIDIVSALMDIACLPAKTQMPMDREPYWRLRGVHWLPCDCSVLPELELYHSPPLQSNHGIINAQNMPHSSESAKASLGTCYASYLVLQGVVTYMSCVEVFVTEIKKESSYQSPFGGPIKGPRWPPNCQKSTCSCNWPLILGNQVIKSLRRNDQAIKHILFADKKTWSQSQTLVQAT